MLASYRIRIYPTPSQERGLANLFGQARWVYNHVWNVQKERRSKGEKYMSKYDSYKLIPICQKEHEWLYDTAVVILRKGLDGLDRAYQNFFKKRTGFPKLKKRQARQSIAFDKFPAQKTGCVTVPKFGSIKGIFYKEMPAGLKRITLIKEANGNYFASLLYETGHALSETLTPTSVVGYDEGLSHFLCTSEGKIVNNPRFARKMESRLRQAQRHLSRSVKGSKRREKKKHRVAVMHTRVRNQRKYFTDLTAFNLCNRAKRKNQAVAHQKMQVKNMQQNRSLSKSIADVGWSQFNRKVEHDCARMGVPLVAIDRFEPTSKRCSSCGRVVPKMPLHIRNWKCECAVHNHRDINGAQVTAKLAAEILGLRGVGTTLPARRRELNWDLTRASVEIRPEEARNCRGSGAGREAGERVA